MVIEMCHRLFEESFPLRTQDAAADNAMLSDLEADGIHPKIPFYWNMTISS